MAYGTAQWNFVVFGLVQGLILVLHRGFRSVCDRVPVLTRCLTTAPGTVLRIAATFGIFCFTLAVFRCATLATGGVMLRRMLVGGAGLSLTLKPLGLWLTFAAVLVCHLATKWNLWEQPFARLPAPVRGLAYGAALTLALLLSPDASKAFIYFQF